MPSPLSQKLTSAYTKEDTMSRDPLTRLRALEETENIPDATSELAGNTMLLASPAGAPVATGINYLKSALAIHNLMQNGGSVHDYASQAANLAMPYAPQWLQFLKGKIGLGR